MCCKAQEKDAGIEKEQIKKAFFYYNNGDMEKSYTLAHTLLKTFKKNKSKASVNLLLAYYFNGYSQVDSSMFYTDRALSIQVSNDSLHHRLMSLAYNLKALNYKSKGLHRLSKKWHLLGIEASQKYNEKNLYYSHIHGLANSYLLLNENEKALEYFNKCKENAKEKAIILGVYINMGAIYSSLKKYDLSNLTLSKAEKLAQKTENKRALASIFLNMGNNRSEVGEVDSALAFYFKAKKISFENGFQNLELILIQNIVDIFIVQKKFDQASLLLSNSIEKAAGLGLLESQMESYKKLSIIFRKKNDFQSALELLTKFHTLKDSINNLQQNKEINRLEVAFRTLEKERAIKVLQVQNINKKLKLKTKDDAIEKLQLEQEIVDKENENSILSLENKAAKRKIEITLLKKKGQLEAVEMKRQKSIQYFILIAFLILLVPIIGLLVMYYQKLQTQSLLHEKEKEVASQNIVSMMKEQELNLIKATVSGQGKERRKIAQEMHDSVGGNLAAIKLQFSQLDKYPENKDLIYKQLDDTYQQVRDLSHNLIPKNIQNNDFVPLIKTYLKNISKASAVAINISIHSESGVNNLEKRIQNELFAMLQELITNSLKHANATTIDVQFDVVGQHLFFVFEDNGKGFDMESMKKGIGLSNMKNRIENIQGHLAIDSHPKRGTIVNIEIEKV